MYLVPKTLILDPLTISQIGISLGGLGLLIALCYIILSFKKARNGNISESWGKYPHYKGKGLICETDEIIKETVTREFEMIPFGNGRSYGDSALNERVCIASSPKHIISFDKEKGILKVKSDILLSQIIEHSIPLGWFLQVTPGTKAISVGGAIASDVHGKNHYNAGCFSAYVLSFSLMLPDGSVITCSQNSNADFFKATCGGMGLTGVILDAEISLKPIQSKYIQQKTLKGGKLSEVIEFFESNIDSPYAVAWLNCVEPKKVGQGVVTLGRFCDDNDLSYTPQKRRRLPSLPYHWFLCKVLIRVFNFLYFRSRGHLSQAKVDIDTFFYPLDALSNWNVLYGKKGLIQYQIIIPLENSYEALYKILQIVAHSNFSANLAVLKRHGPANTNWLSFPLEGYSLALDFKYSNKLLNFLEDLDTIVLQNKGRFYLAKDACVDKETFEQGYPDLLKFRRFRETKHLDLKFNSLQSKRLKL